ncbi:hypothetical protein [Streptomyces justiciae]|uniref:hypothetical protein n=1 Tax=Streptomyces justiciae TaxID=2780140 RepID=UPI0021183030|nr:hypothetical protein [Streptomyces justiciae]MCW8378658.1 hypothetical protein [Streptomyces justiciae]
MRLRPVTLLALVALCLTATASCGGSDSDDDNGPIGARTTSGVDFCELMSDDTIEKILDVKELAVDTGASDDDCSWMIPVDGVADGALQIGSFYMPNGQGMTAIGGLKANRVEELQGCQIVVTTTGETDPAAVSENAEDAVRVWYSGPDNAVEDEECKDAAALAEAVMRALPEAGA